MDKAEILHKLKSIIAEQLVALSEDDMTAESRFVDDLNFDELDFIEVLMKAEEEFDLEVPDEDADGLATVGEMVEYIAATLGIVA